ncbi:WecB/TagA/CpsF family glycosyltransferase [Enterococcus alcedinis]|uniref:WecB/TagA/CpsF family glycosyltransferase n=1 Tax=Enterococcus alcedinis TaxID=1274384 RepID=UPI003616FFB9
MASSGRKRVPYFFVWRKRRSCSHSKRKDRKKYPAINIVGVRNGYFDESENQTIVKEIASTKPDILFVAFSSPMKEYWISEHLLDLNVPFVMGVGGSFDVLAGKTKRAPRWMQKFGLEWFYRFIQEPRRMWKRYIVGNLKFVIYTYQTREK